MDIYNQLLIKVIAAANKVFSGITTTNIVVESPAKREHGDMSTNAAMVLAPQLKKNPREIASVLKGELEKSVDADKLEIAGAGFINFHFRSGFWGDVLNDIITSGENYGHSNVSNVQPVNVEYVSANPTGPMHIGHARGAVVGDALAGILEAVGYSVTREYYINDAGNQIDALVESVFERYREAMGVDIGEFGVDMYPGEYLKPMGKSLASKYGDHLLKVERVNALKAIRPYAIEQMMNMIRDDLAALGVKHQVFFSEKDLHDSDSIGEIISVLEKADKVYTGVIDPPKGMKVEDYETRPQLLFRSTEYGDDVDRALKKSNGSYTYFAADIAYHYNKYQRGFKRQIDIWGADHGGYVKRMKAAVSASTKGEAELEILLTQLVNLTDGGVQVKMSKRSGTFVTLREVVDEVGRDAVRFIMLTRKSDAPLDFDLKQVMEKSASNPVFYVQYAHARACSIFRNAEEQMPDLFIKTDTVNNVDYSLLCHAREIAIIKTLSLWPRVLSVAARDLEPHKVAFYLYDLAAEFHGFWTAGKDDDDLRFIVVNNTALTVSRLALVKAVKFVIASGLRVLGVEPANIMN